MAVAATKVATPKEYLALEDAAEYKNEYIAGEISTNTTAALKGSLRARPCRVFNADVRIWTSDHHGCYPDASVVCGELRRSEQDPNGVANPVLIIEVLSSGTEAYDRGLKFRRYRQIVSLREYVLISQNEPHVEVHTRQDDESWRLTEASGMSASIQLSSIDCTLLLADVYDKVEFTGPEAGSQKSPMV